MPSPLATALDIADRRRQRRWLSLLALAVIGLGARADGAAAANRLQDRDRPYAVDAPGLRLIGIDGDGDLVALADRIRTLLSLLGGLGDPATYTPPLSVLVLPDHATFVRYGPGGGGSSNIRDSEVTGFYVPGLLEDHILLDGNPETSPTETLQHELIHAYLRHHLPRIPLWLNEGLAEYYSNFRVGRSAAGDPVGVLGLPKDRHLALLRTQTPLPLAELLRIDHDSSHYREGHRRGIFYAQSWALAHYLMSDPDRQQATRRYLERVERGDPPDTALLESLDAGSLRSLEVELEGYVQNPATPVELALPAVTIELGASVALDRATFDTEIGELFFALGRYGDAQDRFESALAAERHLPEAMAGMGQLALQRENLPLALEWLEAAAAVAHPPLADYLLGETLVRQVRLELAGGEPPPEDRELLAERLAEARSALARCVGRDPDHGPAQATLGRTYLLEDGLVGGLDRASARDGVTALQRAARLMPDRPEPTVDLALLLCRAGECGQGEHIVDDVLPLYHQPEILPAARLALARTQLELASRLASGEHPELGEAAIAHLLERADAEVDGAVRADAEAILSVAVHNRLVQGFNRALELARAGRYTQARELLAPVIREATDRGLLQSARELDQLLARQP